jgi:aryl-alcohol dehydrogenase-like predicted oxidoreductase
MSRIGLGLAAIGRPAYLSLGHSRDLASGWAVEDLHALTHALLDASWQAGVRYVDCARSYGLAEQFLGSWLASHSGRRDGLTIGSKWGYTYVGGWSRDAKVYEVKDHSVATFERQWPETLEALGTKPDIYLIHSLTDGSHALSDTALLDGLGALAADGVRIGFSTSGPRQQDMIRAALRLGGSSPFSSVQATWNLLDPSAGDALAEAHHAGWRVVVKEPLANGRLTYRGDMPVLAATAERAGVSPDVLAMSAVLAKPWADIVLSGATTLDQLASNLTAEDVDPAALDDAMRTLGSFAEDPATYWRKRSALDWT